MGWTMDPQLLQIVLNDHLECPVCLEFAVSPVQGCGNGHLICGICMDMMNHCSVCTGESSKLIPMTVIDRIMRSEGMLFPCRNGPLGCTLTVQPHEMKSHLTTSCDFRLITCTEETTGRTCEKPSYSPTDLFNHWVRFHKILKKFVIESPSSDPGNCDDDRVLGKLYRTFCMKSLSYKAIMAKPDDKPMFWNSIYFELDGETFIVHTRSKVETIHSWITLLGSEAVANRYKYVGSFRSRNYEETEFRKHKVILFPEIPVHCLQYSDFAKVDALGHTVSVRHNSLSLLMDQQAPTDSKNMYEWSIEFRIIKPNNSACSSTNPDIDLVQTVPLN